MNDIYTAGLFDGEGSIGLPRYKKSELRYPNVTLASTTRELVDFLKLNYGGYISTKRKKAKVHHKEAYQWGVNRTDAINFLNKILPYLKEPEKIRRANLIVDEYLTLTPRNGYYTEEMKRAKLDFQNRFFSTSTHVNA